METKRRRRITPGSGLNKPSEQEQKIILEEAFNRLSCVSEGQFMNWAGSLWEATKFPNTTEDVLFTFCGDCTNNYEQSQRRLGRCNRDEWEEVSGNIFDIDRMRVNG